MRLGNGTFELTNAGFSVCAAGAGPEMDNDANWVTIPMDRQANDTSYAIQFEWPAVNPTMGQLRFALRTGSDAPADRIWYSGSPASLVLDAKGVHELPPGEHLEISATGCPPGGAPAHAAPKDVSPQDVSYRYAWNQDLA